MTSLSRDAVSLLKTYGHPARVFLGEAKLARELAKDAAKDNTYTAIHTLTVPQKSASGRVYAVVGDRTLYDSLVVLCTENGAVSDKDARLLLADFGDYVADKVASTRQASFARRGRWIMLFATIGIALLLALSSKLAGVRLSALVTDHPLHAAFAALILVATVYMVPPIVGRRKASELLQSDKAYNSIAELQALRPRPEPPTLRLVT